LKSTHVGFLANEKSVVAYLAQGRRGEIDGYVPFYRSVNFLIGAGVLFFLLNKLQ